MVKQISQVSKLEFLKILKKLNNNQRSILLHFLSDNALNEICDCIHNTLFENWNLKSTTVKRLRKVLNGLEKPMKTLATKGNTLQRRKKILLQHGGNPLAAILGVAIPL